MHIVHVIPITSGPHDLLSYFSTKHIENGSIVEITIRNKAWPALVVKSERAKSLKLEIKHRPYQLKKVRKIISQPGKITELLLGACKRISSFYQIPIGQVLKLFIPSHILKLEDDLGSAHIKKDSIADKSYENIIGSLQERIQHYKTIIRQALANDRSVCIFVPTINIAEFMHKELSDMPRKPYVMHSGLDKKHIINTAHSYRQSPLSSCLVTTPFALSLLKGNEDIIIEDADSKHYERAESPTLNYTHSLRTYCDTAHARCIFGKYFPSLTDLKEGVHPNYISSRIKPQKQFLISEAPPIANALVGDELRELLNADKKTLIFVSRKGYFTFTICASCNTTLACSSCGAFLIQRKSENSAYICNKCFREYPLDLHCQRCDGWDLRGYGLGTERAFETLKSIFPSRPIWMFDETTANTPQKRANTISLFKNSKDGILVGTDLILEEPSIMAEAAAVLSFDNIFAMPDLAASGRIFTILYKLKEMAGNTTVLIQTRFPKHPMLQHVLNQDIKGYLAQELEERKQENLPPFSLAILLTITEKNARVRQKKIEKLLSRLASFKEHATTYPALGNPSQHHALITIDRQSWQNGQHNLKQTLANCKELADIAIDPKSIL